MENNFNELFPEFRELDLQEKMALEEYYTSVVFLSQKHLNLEFNNKDKYHARIVMSQIFKNVKTEVKIFAGDLNGDVSGSENYLQCLKNALERNVKVDIVLENKPSFNSKCFKFLINYYTIKPELLSIRVLTEEFKKEQTQNSFKHFTIGDNSIFRFEIDTLTYKAICNFDDKNSVTTLMSNFDILKYNSTPVEL